MLHLQYITIFNNLERISAHLLSEEAGNFVAIRCIYPARPCLLGIKGCITAGTKQIQKALNHAYQEFLKAIIYFNNIRNFTLIVYLNT
jgi:hypothetical protein